MAYVTPGTVAAGDVATAAAWNVVVNDIVAFRVPPMVSATRTAAQTISNATWTFISFTSEVFDTANMFTATDTKITIQTTGIYAVHAQAGIAPGNVDFLAKVEKNAATANAGTPMLASNVRGVTLSDTQTILSGMLNLTQGDTLHLSVYQSSGGNYNTAPNPYPTLSAHFVGTTT